MKANNARVSRVIAVLPVIAAIYFQAVALQRWPIAFLATSVLIGGAWTGRTLAISLTGTVVVATIGGIAGLASMITSAPPGGILPPLLTSLFAGVMVALASFFALGGKDHWAWVGAWGLIAMSANTEPTMATQTTLVGFLALSLLAAATQAEAFKTGSGMVAALILVWGGVGATTYGFSRMTTRLEGVIQEAIGGLYYSSRLPTATGVGDEILIGSRSSIAISQRVLFELSGMSGHLRINVMDRFDGQRWFTSGELQSTEYAVDAEDAVDAEHDSSGGLPRPDEARELRIVLFDDPGQKLPSPAGTRQVRGAKARFQGGWVLRGKAEQTTLELIGDPRERLPSESASDPGLLDVPEFLREDLASIAESVVPLSGTDQGKAEALERFFQTEFEYSLDTDLMGPEHPLVQLIRERRPAYCVYFASAMAVLLRAQGVPSRVVSGYVPVERNPITGVVTVRRRDSHAWVEAWIAEENRFVAFDPTPTRSRQQVLGVSRKPGPVSAFIGACASIARRHWLNYQRDPTGFLLVLATSPVLWALLGLLMCLVFAQRSVAGGGKAKREARSTVSPEVRRVHEQYLRSLRRLGVAPQPFETDDELIERLKKLRGVEHAAKANAFIDRYRKVRYRGEPFDDRLSDLSELK